MQLLISSLNCGIRLDKESPESPNGHKKLVKIIKKALRDIQTKKGKRRLRELQLVDGKLSSMGFAVGAVEVSNLIDEFGVKVKRDRLKKLHNHLENQRNLIQNNEQKTVNFIKQIEAVVDNCEENVLLFQDQVMKRLEDFQTMAKGKVAMITG